MVFQDLRIFIFRQVKQSLVFVVMLEYIAAPDAYTARPLYAGDMELLHINMSF